MRVLIDTNVLVEAYFMNDEHAKRVLALCMQQNLSLAVTDAILDEWMYIFGKFTLERIAPVLLEDGFSKALQKLVGLVKSLVRLSARADVLRVGACGLYAVDRADDVFMQCAIDHNIAIIISYDDHLLSLSEKHKTQSGSFIEVLSPLQFWFKHMK